MLHAVMREEGGGPESFACVGHVWLDLPEAQVDLRVGRVESTANPARDSLALLRRKAYWMSSVMGAAVLECV